MTLVIFTGGVGLWMSGGTGEWWRALLGMLCLSFSAGAAGALNMWYERDLDAMMERTKSRPLPMGWFSLDLLIFGTHGQCVVGGADGSFCRYAGSDHFGGC